MNKDIAILREVVGKLTQMLAGMGLRVTQMGAQAYVKTDKDGKPNHVNIPHIPDNAGEDLILAIQGFIDHEVAHIFFTEFMLSKEAMKKGGASLFSLLNIVEDPRIETCMGKRFPGSKLNIERLHGFFFERVTKANVQKAKSIEEAFGYLLVPIIRAWSGQQTFDRLMQDAGYWDHPLVKAFVAAVPNATKARCKTLTSTRDALVIAEELHAILHPPAPPQPKAQPQKSDDKGEKSDQSSDGKDKGEKSDGKGSNKNKPEDDEDQGSKGEKDKSDDNADAETESSKGDKSETDKADEPDQKDDGDEEAKADQKNEADDERGDDADDLGEDGAKGDEEKDDGKSQSEDDDLSDADAEADREDGAGDAGEAEEDEADEKSESGEKDEDDADEDGDEAGRGDIGESSDLDEDEAGGGDAGTGQTEAGDGDADGDLDSESDSGDPEETLKVKPPEHDATIAPQGGENMFQKIEIEIQDFDGSITAVIADQAARDCRNAEYLVYTTEWDDISTPKVDAAYYKDDMLVRLDDTTSHMVGPMQKDIERMMAARAQVQNVAGYRSGRLHSAGLYRLRVGDDRIFRRRFEAKAKETAVTLLIDNSGSMWGEKMRTAMSAGYALSQTLERVGIPYEVMGFTTGITSKTPKSWADDLTAEAKRIGRPYSRACPIIMPIFKDFNERLTPEIKRRFAYYAAAQPGMGANVDGESLAVAGNRLLKRKEQRKVILVLSDGHPASDGPAHEGYAHLHATVEKLTKSRVEVIGIGIMDEAVKGFYPRSMVLRNLEELPKAVMGELRRILLAD